MKKLFLIVSIFAIMALACNVSAGTPPTVPPTLAPSIQLPAATATLQGEPLAPAATVTPEVFISVTQAVPVEPTIPPTASGLTTTLNGIMLTVPDAIATGASGGEYPRVDNPDAAYWEKTPGHRQINLGDYYTLQGKTHQPVIYVYPASAYAELVPAAFESIHRLNNYLNDPTAPIAKDQLPAVPFFNAAQIIAAHVQPVAFQNGRGVRMVSWYTQGLAPVTNQELIYHFEGVTSDGQYYIVAILPVTAPILQADGAPGAVAPTGGVPMPDLNSANLDMKGYYANIQQALNSLQDEAFTPALGQLDALIRSMQVAP